jgi:RES domain-containing protein
MILWRISRHLDLSGEGCVRASGRWNHAGAPMVYTSDSLACALLETCVHLVVDDAPPTFTLLRIAGPDIAMEEISLKKLPENWTSDILTTQNTGVEWLERRRSALLQVPSVLVPETWNYLLNPAHPEAGLFEIERSYKYPFDLRLKQ